jgi:hypothetical protein
LKHIVRAHKFSDEIINIYTSEPQCPQCSQTFDSDDKLFKHAIHEHELTVLRILRDSPHTESHPNRSLITAFIEKHAPSLTSKFTRNYQISSSASESASDSDPEPQDDDYFAFIAGSLHLDGVSATPAVARPISRAKVPAVCPDGVVPSVLTEYLRKMTDYEAFLRTYGLISVVDDKIQCRICKPKRHFDSSVKLLEHAYCEHKIRMTPDLLKVLFFLSPSVNATTPETDLLMNPAFLLDLLMVCPNMRKPAST